MIKRAIGITKFSGHRNAVSGRLPLRSLYEISKIKQKYDYDLNEVSEESICRTIAAQCKAMNVIIVPDDDSC